MEPTDATSDAPPTDGTVVDEPVTDGTLTDEARAGRLADLMGVIELMRPAVQADGGDLVLVAADVETGVVEVQLQGACSSCAVSSSTLQGGVERILRGRLDWVTEVSPPAVVVVSRSVRLPRGSTPRPSR